MAALRHGHGTLAATGGMAGYRQRAALLSASVTTHSPVAIAHCVTSPSLSRFKILVLVAQRGETHAGLSHFTIDQSVPPEVRARWAAHFANDFFGLPVHQPPAVDDQPMFEKVIGLQRHGIGHVWVV